MVKQRSVHLLLIPGLFLLLALAIWLTLMRDFRLDDSFITYRYARNLAAGYGLVYNRGDAVLSTTAPLYAVLLAALSFIIPDFHILGSLIGVISIALGAWLIFMLLPLRIPLALRLWGGLIYMLSSPLWLALGMETALWILLVLVAAWSGQTHRWTVAGFLIGLAVLIRPDAALPGVLMGIGALLVSVNILYTRDSKFTPLIQYIIAAGIPIGLFMLWGLATYGSPLPVTLGAKSAQAELGITGLGLGVTPWNGLLLILMSLIQQSPLYLILGLLVLIGLFSRKLTPFIILVTVWSGLHLVTYIVLGVAPYRWYYTPLLPGVILLAASGAAILYEWLKHRAKPLAIYGTLVAALLPLAAQAASFQQISTYMEQGGSHDVMLPIVDWQAYREAGTWLRDHTSDQATVGVAEVGQIGYYADRWMTDYLGLLQPDVSAMLRRGDFYSWLISYAPDYLVFQRFHQQRLALFNHRIDGDAWFLANYREVTQMDDPRYLAGPVTIMERTTPLLPMITQPVQADFEGLRLVGYAIDTAETQPGKNQSVRIRLDWQVIGNLPAEIHVAIKALDIPEEPGFDGDYATRHWHETLSTWHGFIIPFSTIPGTYPLAVAVGPTGGSFIMHVIGRFQIASP
ncbi:MAG: hypothetical protein K8I60_14910 [Anaerolineae bacterium]|nr:hypothetical protein [Anaerolineae bacterium]